MCHLHMTKWNLVWGADCLIVVIIDEISMVLNDLLCYVHLKLNEIFGCVTNEQIAGI